MRTSTRTPMGDFNILFVSTFLLSIPTISSTSDTIRPSSLIKDGETMISSSGSFELGFFSPDNSRNRYLGIWYKKIAPGTVVWVANRETPLSDFSGVLNITEQGILVLLNITNGVVWSTNTSRKPQNSPVAQLLESGNLVVKSGNDDNPESLLWQSFDYPCDTLLPGMRLGKYLSSGFEKVLSSWKSIDNPARGDYTFQIDFHGFPQLVLKKGNTLQFRPGSWNGFHWTGLPAMKPNPIYTYDFVSTASEIYYKFELKNSSIASRLVLSPTGTAQRFTWIEKANSWARYFAIQVDQCDDYALCGPYASCNINYSPVCSCLKGFAPRSPGEWNLLDWSGGCVRKTKLKCDKGDGFQKYSGVKLPDTSNSWVDQSIRLEECVKICSKNCSCVAYAESDARVGSGCLIWFNEIIDIRDLPESGQDLYVKVAASELDHAEPNRQKKEKKQVAIIVSTIVLIIGMLVFGWILHMRKRKLRKQGKMRNYHEKDYKDAVKKEMELPMFDFATIVSATDNFSSNKKLGQGGFGPVFKGTLIEGQEIAVKRLSKNSGQGTEEFKNEVLLIAKLQHRNLVKLLGCCIKGDERMLIYEYMPNKSLDNFIFDQSRGKLLDWNKRKHIIGGIARGLLYLHQDSRLRIIHRDLKTSNVLLDKDMNPKISDFGMARTLGGDQFEANTRRVVGTYGYMSPEYAVDGHFSVKSDVFSFGVLVLEIVSGKKNRGFCHPDHNHNLLGHAWRLWIGGKPLELVDEVLGDSCALSEVLRCIHIGLLCVQQKPEDRPDISSVVLMLSGDGLLPQPKQPGFFTERYLPEEDSSSGKQGLSSINEVTNSLLVPR